jgi:hypothetical protein
MLRNRFCVEQKATTTVVRRVVHHGHKLLKLLHGYSVFIFVNFIVNLPAQMPHARQPLRGSATDSFLFMNLTVHVIL